jgi:SAM-dependent methyltransferase
MPHAPDAVTRFAGIAADYDAVRPHPPAEIARLLAQWSGQDAPDVTDIGAGTGLSALIWAGRARELIAVEPGGQMRELAAQRLAALEQPGPGPVTRFSVRAGTAEDTGLPAGCAGIVTASQAMHWFDPGRALPEIARILRPGGVFAAYDCDWPPCIDAETDAAYRNFETRYRAAEVTRGLSPPRAPKQGHLEAIGASGLFRDGTEVAVHSAEQGDAARLIAVALSQGGAAALLAAGAPEDEIGLTALRRTAARQLPGPRTWWWTYRIRMAVRA